MIVISVLALAFYLLAIIASLHLLLSAKPVGQVSLFACVGLALTAHGRHDGCPRRLRQPVPPATRRHR